MKITQLTVENFKRIEAVDLFPSANLVFVGGKNKQGKTSIFDFIRTTFGGKAAGLPMPVRTGAAEASGTIRLGDDLRLDLTIKADGTRSLVVRNADGKKQDRPQELAKKFYSQVAFDPYAFARAKPKDQLATLKTLVGVDTTALDAKRATIYEKRTGVGNVRSDAEVRMSQCPVECRSAPDDEVSIAELVAQKDAAECRNRAVDAAAVRVAQALGKLGTAQKALAEAEAELSAAEDGARELPPPVDMAPLAHQIAGAEGINRLVRAKKERAKARETFEAKDREFASMTAQIAAIDDQKTAMLAAAKWPVPGLGFGDDGVLLNRLPLEQASAAETLQVSLAIGAALNPALRVMLVEDASLLDADSLEVVRKMSEEKDLQVWLERVGDADAGAFIIEDGRLATATDTDI
jgi:hypothetical protein